MEEEVYKIMISETTTVQSTAGEQRQGCVAWVDGQYQSEGCPRAKKLVTMRAA